MKNTIVKQKKAKKKSFWFWGLGAVITGILIGICFLFWYTPKAYKPPEVTNSEQTSVYLTNELGPNFFNNIQKDKPFELIIPQDELNNIFIQEFGTETFGDASFSNPHVTFSDKSILLMATLTYNDVSSVLSIKALPIIDNEGKIDLNIQFIRLGMLPVETLVTKLAQKVFDENRSCFEDDPKAAENIQAIIQKKPFDPTFQFSIENRQYQVRITNFQITQGFLKLTLQPKTV